MALSLIEPVMNAVGAAVHAERNATRLARASWEHGPRHWRDVARMGRLITLVDPGADPLVVFLFAAFHDTKRQNEHRDPEHGARAAQAFTALWERHPGLCDAEQASRLLYALDLHDGAMVDGDPTVGACWDADRLTLVRYRMRIDPGLISTSCVRRNLATFVRAANAETRLGIDAAVTPWASVAEEAGLALDAGPVSR